MLSHQQQQKLLNVQLKKPANLYCADCSGKSPTWVSMDFGVFICMNCSGAHRALGPSITRVRSTKLDQWNKDWLWLMQLGNQTINKHFQYEMSTYSNKKPNINSSLNEIKRFVNDKYVKKLYAKAGEHPVARLKNGTYIPDQEEPANPQNYIKQEQKIQKKLTKIKKNLNVDLLEQHLIQAPKSNNVSPTKPQINLFEDQTEQNTYDKHSFNSFSGAGATHSSINHNIDFNTILGNNTNNATHTNYHHPNHANHINHTNHTNLTNPTTNFGNNGTNPHFNTHINPHMDLYTQISNIHQTVSQPNPSHVTMNINMNMYPNIMNINMNLPVSQTPINTNTNNNININANTPIYSNIKFDLGDFSQHNKKVTEIKKQSSWIDQWK